MYALNGFFILYEPVNYFITRFIQHVDRFKKGGAYEAAGARGNYAIVDIEVKSLEMKSQKVKEMTPKFYTFLRMPNSLYLGTTLIREHVARIPSPKYSLHRTFTTCRIHCDRQCLTLPAGLD
jgi:hypothetical protein